MDEGFESDEEYERRRHGKSSKSYLTSFQQREYSLTKIEFLPMILATTNPSTIIKMITSEETLNEELGEGEGERSQNNEPIVPQFKQLEPLKMVKRDQSKEFLPSSSSTSSADTIITVAMRKSLG